MKIFAGGMSTNFEIHQKFYSSVTKESLEANLTLKNTQRWDKIERIQRTVASLPSRRFEVRFCIE